MRAENSKPRTVMMRREVPRTSRWQRACNPATLRELLKPLSSEANAGEATEMTNSRHGRKDYPSVPWSAFGGATREGREEIVGTIKRRTCQTMCND